MLVSPRFRRFAGILSMLFTGTLLGSVLAFVGQILLARSLGIPEFGRLSALLASINFFTPIASAGVNWFVLRVFGQEGWDAVRWLRPAAWLVALATSLSCVGLGCYVGFGGVAPAHAEFVLPASIIVLLGQVAVELGSACFQIEDRYKGLTLWQVATQAGRFLVVLVAWFFGGATELEIIGGYGALGVVLSLIGARSVWALWRKAARKAVPLPLARPRVRDTLPEATPYALMTVFYIVYFQGTVVLIASLAGSAAAAEYNASFLIFSALSLIPNVVYLKFLAARLCRWAETDRTSFTAAFHVGVPTMAVLGASIATVLIATAHWLVPLLYGSKYTDATILVMIRAVAIPIGFAQMSYSSLFISRTDISRKVGYLGITAATSVAANFILVPAIGLPGAAVASVIAETVLLLLHMRGAGRHIPGIELAATLRPATLIGSIRHLIKPEQSRSTIRCA